MSIILSYITLSPELDLFWYFSVWCFQAWFWYRYNGFNIEDVISCWWAWTVSMWQPGEHSATRFIIVLVQERGKNLAVLHEIYWKNAKINKQTRIKQKTKYIKQEPISYFYTFSHEEKYHASFCSLILRRSSTLTVAAFQVLVKFALRETPMSIQFSEGITFSANVYEGVVSFISTLT